VEARMKLLTVVVSNDCHKVIKIELLYPVDKMP
jgi:hypothetical protein